MIQRRDAAKSLTARVADTLIEEVEAAEVIVIAAPMYIYLVCPPSFGSTVPVATGYFFVPVRVLCRPQTTFRHHRCRALEGSENGGFLRLSEQISMVGATGIEPVTPTV